MIKPSATVLRVRETLGHDTVLVEEVGGLGRVESYFSMQSRIIKSAAMSVVGVDSFWRVSGEHSEKPPSFKPEKPYRPGTKSQSYSAFNAKNTTAPMLQATTSNTAEFAPNGNQSEFVTFKNEQRLTVGYSDPLGDHGKTLGLLFGPGLPSPLRRDLEAVQVADGLWLLPPQLRNGGGLWFAQGKKRAVAGHHRIDDGQTQDAGGGLIVFLTPPRWVEASPRDCRTEAEAANETLAWLQRFEQFDGRLHGDPEVQRAIGVLKSSISAGISQEDFDDLAAAIQASQSRPHLHKLLPDLLRSDPYWREQVQTTVAQAVELKRGEIDAAFADEIAQKEQTLARLQSEIAEAERRLSTAEERERAYRAGAEELRTRLEDQIASVARDVLEPVLETRAAQRAAELRNDLDRLASRVAQVEEVTAHSSSTSSAAEESATALRVCTSRDDRSRIFTAVAADTSLQLSELGFILANMFSGGLPVLAGAEATAAAIRIVSMLGGTSKNVIFCDPTKVSLRDLYEGDGHDGLGSLISVAKGSPDTFIPLALCGLTYSPCEFWLPALLEGRRIGTIPSNLAIVAAVAPDGIRTEVPKSLLRRFQPLLLGEGVTSPSPDVSGGHGLWPIPDKVAAEQKQIDAITMLASIESDGKALATAITDLSTLLCQIDGDLSGIADQFRKQSQWLGALSSATPADHPLYRYFANFEG